MPESLICWVLSEHVDREELELGGEVLQNKDIEGRDVMVDARNQPEGISSGEMIADHLLCEHRTKLQSKKDR